MTVQFFICVVEFLCNAHFCGVQLYVFFFLWWETATVTYIEWFDVFHNSERRPDIRYENQLPEMGMRGNWVCRGPFVFFYDKENVLDLTCTAYLGVSALSIDVRNPIVVSLNWQHLQQLPASPQPHFYPAWGTWKAPRPADGCLAFTWSSAERGFVANRVPPSCFLR